MLETKKTKEPLFQVLLLDNDESQDVKVQEAEKVDFYTVKKHLKSGGSVFITTRKQQKLTRPKNKQSPTSRTRKNYAVIQATYREQLNV